MSRASRFDKLEGEREGGGEKRATGASLERFGAEPELSPRAPQADPMAPEHGAQRLQRFEEDGNQGLGLDRDPLASLPMLECPSCATACGKFETACHGCGASLTSEAARAHNLKRLEALQAERAVGLEAEREKRELAFVETETRNLQRETAARQMAQELREDLTGESESRTRRLLPKLAVGALGLALAVFGKGGGAVVGGLLLLVGVMTLLPRWVWLKLGQKARWRDRD
ncbi:MAG: hypothetical protein H6Q89_3987 [Myxococcaceae bacterium]|nr:hypothetical protein [Myxococcaceae bacterium]